MEGPREVDIFTPAQVAGYLHLRKDTIYRYIRAGKLPAVRLGRYYRVSRDDLDVFLLANRTGQETRDRVFEHVLEIARRNPYIPQEDVERGVEEGLAESRNSKDVRSGSPRRVSRHPGAAAKRVKVFTEKDPLWNIVGIADVGPRDVSENKHKYLADALDHAKE